MIDFFKLNGLKCDVEYNENIDSAIIELIWNKILVLMDWVLGNRDQAIKETNVLTIQEQGLKNSVNIDFDF